MNMIINKKARRDYEISDTVVAGLVLSGQEVKSLRQGRGSLRDSHAKFMSGELYLIGADIPRYSHSSSNEYDPKRSRKLLLNKREIENVLRKIEAKNLSLIPTKMFFKGRWVKVELGLGRGKREYEKREAKKRKDLDREAERELKSRG